MNFLNNSYAKQKDIMNKIFNKFSEFKKYIKTVFKDINTKYIMKRELINL